MLSKTNVGLPVAHRDEPIERDPRTGTSHLRHKLHQALGTLIEGGREFGDHLIHYLKTTFEESAPFLSYCTR